MNRAENGGPGVQGIFDRLPEEHPLRQIREEVEAFNNPNLNVPIKERVQEVWKERGTIVKKVPESAFTGVMTGGFLTSLGIVAAHSTAAFLGISTLSAFTPAAPFIIPVAGTVAGMVVGGSAVVLIVTRVALQKINKQTTSGLLQFNISLQNIVKECVRAFDPRLIEQGADADVDLYKSYCNLLRQSGLVKTSGNVLIFDFYQKMELYSDKNKSHISSAILEIYIILTMLKFERTGIAQLEYLSSVLTQALDRGGQGNQNNLSMAQRQLRREVRDKIVVLEEAEVALLIEA